jgi:hypothetical protein
MKKHIIWYHMMIDCPVIALKFSHFWIHQLKDFRKNVSRRFSRWLRFNCHCLQATRSTQVASFVFGYIGTENSRVPWKRPSKSHRFWKTFTMEFHESFFCAWNYIFSNILFNIYINLHPRSSSPSQLAGRWMSHRSGSVVGTVRSDRNWSGFTHQKGREKVGFNW